MHNFKMYRFVLYNGPQVHTTPDKQCHCHSYGANVDQINFASQCTISKCTVLYSTTDHKYIQPLINNVIVTPVLIRVSALVCAFGSPHTISCLHGGVLAMELDPLAWRTYEWVICSCIRFSAKRLHSPPILPQGQTSYLGTCSGLPGLSKSTMCAPPSAVRVTAVRAGH